MNGLLQSLLRPQRRSFLLIHDCFHLSSTNVVSWTGSNICLDPDVDLVQYDIDPCTTSFGKFTVGDTAPHVRGPVPRLCHGSVDQQGWGPVRSISLR